MAKGPSYARVKPGYGTYRSPYAPSYSIPKNFHGFDARAATKIGLTAAGFAGVAGFFAIFFFSDIPRVRKDIMQKIPFLGDNYVKEVPASDNPF